MREIVRDILYTCLQNLACILHLQCISIPTGDVSCAQQPRGPVDTVLGSASVGSALDTRIILGLYEGYNPRKVT